ncbi:hypothetical protein XENOCAPTIV_017351, partial [Xenoophorus captivus]
LVIFDDKQLSRPTQYGLESCWTPLVEEPHRFKAKLQWQPISVPLAAMVGRLLMQRCSGRMCVELGAWPWKPEFSLRLRLNAGSLRMTFILMTAVRGPRTGRGWLW